MNLQYPIGEFQHPGKITAEHVNGWINDIKNLPNRLQQLVGTLSEEQLDMAYRDGGWSVRQVVHHIADSHMNAYIRFKWALTEDQPVIKAYHEAKWAELPDSKLPIGVSISLISALHERWTYLLENLDEDNLKIIFIHPESGEVTLEENIGRYAWHGEHHFAHIQALCCRMDWL
ncbi:YfiT family bacillithiol transferase [Cytobacillus gottheilii]|uniref:YfiT family bacillithiol transferase n=1 Tax=Cytobacillus gottheilii TaxID=859144 RepID=UPI003CED33D6